MTHATRTATVALAMALCLTASGVAAQGPLERPGRPIPVIVDPDAAEFRNSCASCHGEHGKGAGFLTRVFAGINPGDLTQLSARNGGTFPLEKVFRVIDGRAEVAAHGDRRMPVWGDRYMTAAMSEWGPDELNALRVRNRIYSLVHYLQSIQEPAADEG